MCAISVCIHTYFNNMVIEPLQLGIYLGFTTTTTRSLQGDLNQRCGVANAPPMRDHHNRWEPLRKNDWRLVYVLSKYRSLPVLPSYRSSFVCAFPQLL